MSEILLAHHSVCDWSNASIWSSYLEGCQNILGVSLTSLDINDPIKRKVKSLGDAGDYICNFKQSEDSRWLFGRFEELDIEFSIQHYRKIGHYSNTLRWHLPATILASESFPFVRQLFDVGNAMLHPFYAFGDLATQVSSKKKSTGAIDIQAELLGIFWLTYFSDAYVKFFSAERFRDLDGIVSHVGSGVTVELGKCPNDVSEVKRKNVAFTLGKNSFVDVTDLAGKRPGKYALTFQQLMSADEDLG